MIKVHNALEIQVHNSVTNSALLVQQLCYWSLQQLIKHVFNFQLNMNGLLQLIPIYCSKTHIEEIVVVLRCEILLQSCVSMHYAPICLDNMHIQINIDYEIRQSSLSQCSLAPKYQQTKNLSKANIDCFKSVFLSQRHCGEQLQNIEEPREIKSN